jgi:hypothetical protein
MMSRPLSLSRALAAILAILPLQAQDPALSLDLKLRTGYGLTTADHLRNASMGFGFNLAWALPVGTLGLEAGYYYKTGDSYLEPIRGDVPADLAPVNLAKAGDSRRNQLDGFSVRASFLQRFSEDWSWQAGLMVGGTRFKHEYVGDVQGQNWVSDPAYVEQSWRDTYNGTPVKSAFDVSPYAGFTYALTGHSSLEMNVLLLHYTAIDYVHHPGSGSYALSSVSGADPSVGRIADNNAFPADTFDQRTRWTPQVELNYVFHF